MNCCSEIGFWMISITEDSCLRAIFCWLCRRRNQKRNLLKRKYGPQNYTWSAMVVLRCSWHDPSDLVTGFVTGFAESSSSLGKLELQPCILIPVVVIVNAFLGMMHLTSFCQWTCGCASKSWAKHMSICNPLWFPDFYIFPQVSSYFDIFPFLSPNSKPTQSSWIITIDHHDEAAEAKHLQQLEEDRIVGISRELGQCDPWAATVGYHFWWIQPPNPMTYSTFEVVTYLVNYISLSRLMEYHHPGTSWWLDGYALGMLPVEGIWLLFCLTVHTPRTRTRKRKKRKLRINKWQEVVVYTSFGK